MVVIVLTTNFLATILAYKGDYKMDIYDADRHILDLIYDEDIREDYADIIIEDIMEEIEEMEDKE